MITHIGTLFSIIFVFWKELISILKTIQNSATKIYILLLFIGTLPALLIGLAGKNIISGFALDVFENEPEINEKLFNLKNVVLAPHLGSATNESRVAMGARVIENIISFVSGQVPKDKIY